MDARTRKLAGLAIIAVGVVLAVLGGLADQIGIGANDESEIGGKQVAALVVGVLLIAAGAVLATVLAKDTGEPGATAEVGDAADAIATPASGTPLTDVADDNDAESDDVAPDDDESDDAAEPSAEAEPVEATDSSD